MVLSYLPNLGSEFPLKFSKSEDLSKGAQDERRRQEKVEKIRKKGQEKAKRQEKTKRQEKAKAIWRPFEVEREEGQEKEEAQTDETQEQILEKEWERALAREARLEDESGGGWKEEVKRKRRKVVKVVVKVGKSFTNYNIISNSVIQETKTIPGLERRKKGSQCTGGATLMPSCKAGKFDCN